MSHVSVKARVQQSCSLFFKEVEVVACPSFVFCIGYLHHLYFSHDLISPIFFACSLLSVALVLAYAKPGLIASSLIQAALASYVLYDAPELFAEQATFSLSVLTALTATYYSRQNLENVHITSQIIVSKEPEVPIAALPIVEQKDKLWQELFDARKEIAALYSEKEALAHKLVAIEVEHANQKLELEHRIEAYQMDKAFLMEEKEETENEIASLIDKMRELAERKEPKKSLEPFEAMYSQLKGQFEEKTKVLEATRKELFLAEEQIEVLKRTLELEVQVPSQIERALSYQLAETNKNLEELYLAHQDELMGYEQVIQGLLSQIK